MTNLRASRTWKRLSTPVAVTLCFFLVGTAVGEHADEEKAKRHTLQASPDCDAIEQGHDDSCIDAESRCARTDEFPQRGLVGNVNVLNGVFAICKNSGNQFNNSFNRYD
jgi:hypothetical protein